jgi:hypothetical protein
LWRIGVFRIDGVARFHAHDLRAALDLKILAHVIVLLDVAIEAILLAVELGLVVLLALLEQAVSPVRRMLCILTLRFAARSGLELIDLSLGGLRSLLSFRVALGALLIAAFFAHHTLWDPW